MTFSLLREPFRDSMECEYRCDSEWVSHTFVAGFTSVMLFFFLLLFNKNLKNFKELRTFHCWLLRYTEDSASIYDCYRIFPQETGQCCSKAFYVQYICFGVSCEIYQKKKKRQHVCNI